MTTNKTRLLLWSIGALLLSGCKDDPPPYRPLPMFNRCESDADCSEATPDCIALDPAGSGNPVKVCTRDCTEDPFLCPSAAPVLHPTLYFCIPVDPNGKIDPTGSRSVCHVAGCLPGPAPFACGLGETSSDFRGGEC
ncbi:MAG: hypothetical protein H5U40_06900, partial [Polyangiaceae bacterium]|nr:hypothetical protein [Polyangiaceae bacterium]